MKNYKVLAAFAYGKDTVSPGQTKLPELTEAVAQTLINNGTIVAINIDWAHKTESEPEPEPAPEPTQKKPATKGK